MCVGAKLSHTDPCENNEHFTMDSLLIRGWQDHVSLRRLLGLIVAAGPGTKLIRVCFLPTLPIS